MKKTFVSLACIATLGFASLQAHAEETAVLEVKFQGPGGHSQGNYGRTNAVHAAGRTLVKLQSAGLPAGSYVVTDLSGGNSVNSIAGDAQYKVHLKAADAAALEALKTKVTDTVVSGVKAENDFRNVKTGDLTAGAPAEIRYTVTAK